MLDLRAQSSQAPIGNVHRIVTRYGNLFLNLTYQLSGFWPEPAFSDCMIDVIKVANRYVSA